jgi:hypothetical protein
VGEDIPSSNKKKTRKKNILMMHLETEVHKGYASCLDELSQGNGGYNPSVAQHRTQQAITSNLSIY